MHANLASSYIPPTDSIPNVVVDIVTVELASGVVLHSSIGGFLVNIALVIHYLGAYHVFGLAELQYNHVPFTIPQIEELDELNLICSVLLPDLVRIPTLTTTESDTNIRDDSIFHSTLMSSPQSFNVSSYDIFKQSRPNAQSYDQS